MILKTVGVRQRRAREASQMPFADVCRPVAARGGARPRLAVEGPRKLGMARFWFNSSVARWPWIRFRPGKRPVRNAERVGLHTGPFT